MVFTIYGHGGHFAFRIMIVYLNLVNYHINAKYEISIKLAQYFHREMSFEIFRERLPWQLKLPCNFHKSFIYAIKTLFLIFQ